jgi:hypothetical protein
MLNLEDKRLNIIFGVLAASTFLSSIACFISPSLLNFGYFTTFNLLFSTFIGKVFVSNLYWACYVCVNYLLSTYVIDVNMFNIFDSFGWKSNFPTKFIKMFEFCCILEAKLNCIQERIQAKGTFKRLHSMDLM